MTDNETGFIMPVCDDLGIIDDPFKSNLAFSANWNESKIASACVFEFLLKNLFYYIT
jgi:hypothetical protein